MSSSTSSSRRFLFAFAIAFAVVFGGSVVATEVMLRRQVAPFDTQDAYRARLLTSMAPAAAFGDSHVANGLTSTDGFDNFGQAADNWSTVIAKVERRMQRGGLERVVLQADPQYFAAYRLKADQETRIADLEQGAPSPLMILRSQYRQFLMRYWWAVVTDPALMVRPPAPAATRPPFDQWPAEEQQRDASIRVQLHTPVADLEQTEAAQAFDLLLTRLGDAGVQTCVVAFPVSSVYRRAANGATFDSARSFFRSAASRHGVKFVDLSATFPDDRFADPDHLQTRYAAVLQEQLLSSCFGSAS